MSKSLDEKKSFDGAYPEEETSDMEQGEVKQTEVKRGLKQRHVSMIALGGTIGTGLFIGLSTPLATAGPVGALLGYILFGFFAYIVTQQLGEMATHTPVSGSFCAFNTKYLSKAIGFSTNWCYWFSWAITFAIELFAIGQCLQYWNANIPSWVWMLVFYVVLTAANFFPVRFYGEVEFWIALIKVLAICGFLIFGLCMVCGAGADGKVGFRYWRNPGAFGPGAGLIANLKGDQFLAWIESLIDAAFTYQGVELTGITAGESANPRKTVPSAINKVIYRILLFYIGSLIFVGLLVPYNDSALEDETTFISSSPFLIAISRSGTPVLPDIFNAVILCTVISAGNSNIYIGSRVLYAMGGTVAPKCYKWTTKGGVPYIGVFTTSAFGLLAFLNVSNSGTTVFGWLENITAVAGLVAWIFISAAHLRFMAILKSRGISRDTLPFKARWMPVTGWITFIALIIIIFIQGFEVFFNFDVSTFFASYISLVLFFVLWIGSQLTVYRKEPWLLPLDAVDIDSASRKIDEEVWDDNAPKSWFDKFWDTVL